LGRLKHDQMMLIKYVDLIEVKRSEDGEKKEKNVYMRALIICSDHRTLLELLYWGRTWAEETFGSLGVEIGV